MWGAPGIKRNIVDVVLLRFCVQKGTGTGVLIQNTAATTANTTKRITRKQWHSTITTAHYFYRHGISVVCLVFCLHSVALIQNRHINTENLDGNKTKKKQNKQIIQSKIQIQTMHKKCLKILDTDDTCTRQNEWWRTELLQWNIASITHERVSLVTRAANLFHCFHWWIGEIK